MSCSSLWYTLGATTGRRGKVFEEEAHFHPSSTWDPPKWLCLLGTQHCTGAGLS